MLEGERRAALRLAAVERVLPVATQRTGSRSVCVVDDEVLPVWGAGPTIAVCRVEGRRVAVAMARTERLVALDGDELTDTSTEALIDGEVVELVDLASVAAEVR